MKCCRQSAHGLTQVTGLERSMFSGAALSIVLISHDDPLNALGLVISGSAWDWAKLTSRLHAQNVVGKLIRSQKVR